MIADAHLLQGHLREHQNKREPLHTSKSLFAAGFGYTCSGSCPVIIQFPGIVLMQKVQSPPRPADFPQDGLSDQYPILPTQQSKNLLMWLLGSSKISTIPIEREEKLDRLFPNTATPKTQHPVLNL
ncbi:hypothetical protein [Parasedimentitalea denitrificans]|uniref:hypothetical protein n=1 Tax=Parasedimentitalea denitrificans TaxID=2211118 RepID=UPI00143107B4|nr:hypothetical protein [Sedimentitalea sp. CY04]